MAGPQPLVEICLDNGKRLRQALIESSPVAIWPLDDVYSNVTGELLRGFAGRCHYTYRGQPGLIPEYGSSYYWDGNGWAQIPHDDDLEGGTQFAVSAVIRLPTIDLGSGSIRTIVRKENGGVAGRIAVYLVGATYGVQSDAQLDTRSKRASVISFLSPYQIAPPHPDGSVDLTDARHEAWAFSNDGAGPPGPQTLIYAKLVFAITLGGVGYTLMYDIPDLTPWVNYPRMIVCRKTTTAMQIWELNHLGVKTLLAQQAISGAMAAGTRSDLYLGSWDGVRDYWRGWMQWVTWWGNGIPDDSDLDVMAASMKWTDVTTDVRTSTGIDVEWGIRDSGPMARLGTTGTLQFSLDNSVANSVGTMGYYSPDHASKRPGFGYGCMVRLSIIDPALGSDWPYRKFIGTLREIEPEPGVHGQRVTRCLVTDYFDEMTSAVLPSMPMVENELSGMVLARIVDAIPIKPHGWLVASWGAESFPFGFDRSDNDSDVILREFGRVVDSELASGLYLRGGRWATDSAGWLTYDARRVRATIVTPQWTISNAMVALDAGRKRGDVITRVRVKVYPRSVSPGYEVLWRITEPVAFAKDEVLVFVANFTDLRADTSTSGNPVGGTSLVTPQYGIDLIGTDERGNPAEQWRVQMEPGAVNAKLTITNMGTWAATLTTLQIRGRAVYSSEEVVLEAENAAMRMKHGETLLDVDQPYQDVASLGKTAADYLMRTWSTERSMARSVSVRVGNGSPAALVTTAVAADNGDLIALTETLKGINGQHYFIHGVSMHMEAAGVLETTFFLQPREQGGAGLSWIIGAARLGVDTYPVY